MSIFVLPELGENVASGTVARILVAVGDTIAKDQGVVELETDKATVEVPSTVAGVVRSIAIKPGDKVAVGTLVLEVEDTAAAPAAPAASAASASLLEVPARTEPEARPGSVSASAQALATQFTPAVTEPVPTPNTPAAVVPFPSPSVRSGIAPASPRVRRLAREIGVDVNAVSGTGLEGRITQHDVKAFATRALATLVTAPPAGAAPAHKALPDASRWGEVERQPMSSVRRATAVHLAHAWTTIPHVTQVDKADITEIEAIRKRFAPDVEAAGGKLTMTAILVKVLAAAVQQFPQFNACVDMAAEEIVYRKYVNVGVAVDTDRGLLVPVVRNADRKGLTQISVDVQVLAAKARDKKLSLDDMSGGGISISNLGGIGGTSFTPIVNWPEVAILGVSRGATEPVWKNGAFEPRLMLPLSLSYDHRLIDGADAIRFLRWIVETLEQPHRLALA
jgi:pyruvate dehydrogenase E2 component (dihydrolipoamide acetyltransferase)